MRPLVSSLVAALLLALSLGAATSTRALPVIETATREVRREKEQS